jgi:U3 small nucleolar RNA-associated protein 20
LSQEILSSPYSAEFFVKDDESYFREALNHWKLQSLAPAFVQFARRVDPLSDSMASLLHNWQEIVELLVNVLEMLEDEVLKPMLRCVIWLVLPYCNSYRSIASLLQNLTQDLRATLLPSYKDILDRLVYILMQSLPAASFTALLTAFSSVFKNVLIPSSDMDLFKTTWVSLRGAIPRCIPEAQKAIAEVWGLVLRVTKSPARETLALTMAESLEDIEDACAWMFVFACKVKCD